LGVLGKLYAVEEVSVREFINRRLQRLQQEGRLSEPVDAMKASAHRFIEQPPGQGLPRADEYQHRFFDPSFSAPFDIADKDGKVLYKRGTRVNPLHHMTYSRAMCFINGSDPEQVQWAMARCGDPFKHRLIALDGNLSELQRESVGIRWFFDQYGQLARHFQLQRVPAVIRQSGDQLAIEEFPL